MHMEAGRSTAECCLCCPLLQDGGITLAGMEELLKPMAKTGKFHVCQSAYTLNSLAKAPNSRGGTGGGASLTTKLPASRLGRLDS